MLSVHPYPVALWTYFETTKTDGRKKEIIRFLWDHSQSSLGHLPPDSFTVWKCTKYADEMQGCLRVCVCVCVCREAWALQTACKGDRAGVMCVCVCVCVYGWWRGSFWYHGEIGLWFQTKLSHIKQARSKSIQPSVSLPVWHHDRMPRHTHTHTLTYTLSNSRFHFSLFSAFP